LHRAAQPDGAVMQYLPRKSEALIMVGTTREGPPQAARRVEEQPLPTTGPDAAGGSSLAASTAAVEIAVFVASLPSSLSDTPMYL